jgi:hypothetical protein
MSRDGLLIGEAGNLVVLKKERYLLVDAIKSGLPTGAKEPQNPVTRKALTFAVLFVPPWPGRRFGKGS